MGEFIAARLKAFAAALIVGALPVVIKAFETSTGFDIPGSWEISWQTLVQAWLAGLGVNYIANVKSA
jgi:hypothetical protein